MRMGCDARKCAQDMPSHTFYNDLTAALHMHARPVKTGMGELAHRSTRDRRSATAVLPSRRRKGSSSCCSSHSSTSSVEVH